MQKIDLERLEKLDALIKELRNECLIKAKFDRAPRITDPGEFPRTVIPYTDTILELISSLKGNSTCVTK